MEGRLKFPRPPLQLVCRYAVAQAAQHSRLAVGLEERGQQV